jgi:hypothetical protein
MSARLTTSPIGLRIHPQSESIDGAILARLPPQLSPLSVLGVGGINMVRGNIGTGISELNDELTRLRRRAARQKRTIAADPEAWQRWSSSMDEIAVLTERLVASPAANIDSLAAKFRAILWLIEVNDSLLDHGDLRRLRRFGRELNASMG